MTGPEAGPYEATSDDYSNGETKTDTQEATVTSYPTTTDYSQSEGQTVAPDEAPAEDNPMDDDQATVNSENIENESQQDAVTTSYEGESGSGFKCDQKFWNMYNCIVSV